MPSKDSRVWWGKFEGSIRFTGGGESKGRKAEALFTNSSQAEGAEMYRKEKAKEIQCCSPVRNSLLPTPSFVKKPPFPSKTRLAQNPQSNCPTPAATSICSKVSSLLLCLLGIALASGFRLFSFRFFESQKTDLFLRGTQAALPSEVEGV